MSEVDGLDGWTQMMIDNDFACATCIGVLARLLVNEALFDRDRLHDYFSGEAAAHEGETSGLIYGIVARLLVIEVPDEAAPEPDWLRVIDGGRAAPAEDDDEGQP